jgi:hypothetical protein
MDLTPSMTLKSSPVASLAAALALIAGAPHPANVRAERQAAQAASSYTLIAQALAAGQIDQETAYKYRVFAAFGDSRLPVPYRGDDAGIEVPPSVLEAGSLVQSFSAQTQADLAPFFMPPAEPGSWLTLPTIDSTDAVPSLDDEGDTRAHGPSVMTSERRRQAQAIRWHTVPAAGGKVKVWAQLRYAGDSAKAEAIAREISSTIWPELVRLFWEPLSDATSVYDNGGPELDVFLVRPTSRDTARIRAQWGGRGDWRGLTLPSTPGRCDDGAHFLLIRSDRPLGSATSSGLLQIVAHEMTHAITGKLPLKGDCKQYTWIREATGTWSEHWVYPNAQSEHERAPKFYIEKRRSLDKIVDETELYEYGSYLFPLHLMLSGRRERAIPQMWREFANHDTRAGINAALQTVGTTLDKVFPEFAVQNLNRATADDYKRIDGLPDSPEVNPDSFQVSVGGATGSAAYEKEMFMGMRYLSTRYVHFNFDASVRTVTFDNTLVPIQWAGVWGIEKIGGTWQKPADWTAEHSKMWCRDVATEDIEALVLVFTNKEWQDTLRTVDPGRFRPTLRALPTGCSGWTGTADMENTLVSTDPAITIVESVHSTMRFAVDSALILAGQPIEYWKTVGGHITWRVEVTGKCSGSAQGGLPIPNLANDHVGSLRIWEEGGKLHHSGANGPWPADIPRYTITCPGGEAPSELMLMGALGFWVTDFAKDDVAPDGKSFSGDHVSQLTPGIVTRHRYSFRCAAGC